MGAKKKDKLEERDITGLKFVDKLAPLLERLHEDGCERDRAEEKVSGTTVWLRRILVNSNTATTGL